LILDELFPSRRRPGANVRRGSPAIDSSSRPLVTSDRTTDRDNRNADNVISLIVNYLRADCVPVVVVVVVVLVVVCLLAVKT